MKGFEENNCRLCEKVFCCKKCREQHEKIKHDIFSNCDICIYGQVQLSSASSELVDHMRRRHWPLHCLICKNIFGSTDELFQHSKCPIGRRITNESKKSPNKLVQLYVKNPYDSPRLSSNNFDEKRRQSNKNIISKLATSTPMQWTDNNMWEKIPDVIITPEYYSLSKKSRVIKKRGSDSYQMSGPLMKRVTYGQTPITPLVDSQYNTRNMAAVPGNMQVSTNFNSTNNSGASSSGYYSAKEEQTQRTVESKISEIMQNVPSIKVTDATDVKEDKTKDGPEINERTNIPDHGEEESTVWISAINMSAAMIDENDCSPYQNQDLAQFVTPILPNYKKKPVNMVMPSPITNNDIDIKFHGAVQISSTPNCSSMPMKSAPKHRVIFRCEESLPSYLDSNGEIVQVTTNNQNDIENSRTNVVEHSTTENCRGTVSKRSQNSDVSMQSRLWTSVSRIVKNVTDAIQSFSSVEGITPSATRSVKRQSSDMDFLDAGPYIKRYKLTEIKCRQTIRELPPIERFLEPYILQESNKIHTHAVNNLEESMTKTFSNKATQTDESI